MANLYCVELDSWFPANRFFIDEYYHFEDAITSSGDGMLYAISSTYGLNGFLVDTYFDDEDSISLEWP